MTRQRVFKRPELWKICGHKRSTMFRDLIGEKLRVDLGEDIKALLGLKGMRAGAFQRVRCNA